MTFSRIDIIGQNGNDGQHYINPDAAALFEKYIKGLDKTEPLDLEFLYNILDEIKVRDRLINILRSDHNRLQELAWDNHKG